MASEVTGVLLSDGYREQLSRLHARQAWGAAGKSHAPEVEAWATAIGAMSILDYGCGRGTLKAAVGLPVAEYDPGVAGKDGLPAPADLVVATDVLEHVEPDRLDDVLAHLERLAGKGAYLVIALKPARETLPDGRNAHLIVEPADWWLRALGRRSWTVVRSEVRKGLNVWIRK